MQSISVKKMADLEAVFGTKVAKVVKGFRKSFMKVLPSTIMLTETKPAFYLNDGGMLWCYALNLDTGEILGSRYCGSGDSAVNSPEQFNETAKAPGNHALLFVETYPSTANHPWTLTVVSPDITQQLKGKSC